MSFVDYELSNHIGVIRMNRPERLNAMSAEMREDLGAAFKEFNHNDDAWVGIITGTGRAFCAGRDMKAQIGRYAEGGGKLVGRVYTPENNMFGLSDTLKPLIAAVNGYAIGMGWYMVANCDIRIAAEDAVFAMTEIATGALPPFWFSPTEGVPWPVGAEFALVGEHVSAQRLLGLNLLNAVVPGNELMDEARRWADKLTRMPPKHLQKAKELMLAMRPLPNTEVLMREREVRGYLAELHDSREAVEAWSQKRPARYTGT
jgi:E-phenylitaconyl-CoA hydratase